MKKGSVNICSTVATKTMYCVPFCSCLLNSITLFSKRRSLKVPVIPWCNIRTWLSTICLRGRGFRTTEGLLFGVQPGQFLFRISVGRENYIYSCIKRMGQFTWVYVLFRCTIRMATKHRYLNCKKVYMSIPFFLASRPVTTFSPHRDNTNTSTSIIFSANFNSGIIGSSLKNPCRVRSPSLTAHSVHAQSNT